MNTVPRHTFSKLVHFRLGHGILGTYFQMKYINKQTNYCECGQLETAEHFFKKCPLHPVEQNLLRKDPPELDLKTLLDAKRDLV